jgi:hypothetical protein
MPIPLIGILLLMLLHIGFQHETELLEDSLALPGFPPFSCKFGSSEEEYVDSDDLANSRPRTRPSAIQNPPLTDSNLVTVPSGSMKQEFRRRHVPHGWLHKMVLPKLFCSNHIVFLLFCESPPPFPPHPLFPFLFPLLFSIGRKNPKVFANLLFMSKVLATQYKMGQERFSVTCGSICFCL